MHDIMAGGCCPINTRGDKDIYGRKFSLPVSTEQPHPLHTAAHQCTLPPSSSRPETTRAAVQVDAEHKATAINIFSFSKPHMRAFHTSWFNFFSGYTAFPPTLGEYGLVNWASVSVRSTRFGS